MLENHVTNLELSKRLHEIGIKKASLFYWIDGDIHFDVACRLINIDENGEIIEFDSPFEDKIYPKEIYSAFIASELLQFIPKVIDRSPKDKDLASHLIDYTLFDKYNFYLNFHWGSNSGRYEYFLAHKNFKKEFLLNFRDDSIIKDENEANARAKYLIILIENGLVKAEDLTK